MASEPARHRAQRREVAICTRSGSADQTAQEHMAAI